MLNGLAAGLFKVIGFHTQATMRINILFYGRQFGLWHSCSISIFFSLFSFGFLGHVKVHFESVVL